MTQANEDRIAQRQAKLQAASEELQRGVEQLVSSEDWQQVLEAQARFPSYSARNIVFLLAQSRARGVDLSRVAGYRRWQELGRQVRQGERGFVVFAPVVRTDDDGEKKVVAFTTRTVFDVSQTDGEPLPEVPGVRRLSGDAPSALRDGLVALIEREGYRLQSATWQNEQNGETNFAQRTVTIREGLDDAQRVKTLAHELAHIRLDHNPALSPSSRPQQEVEAESVAFLVCSLGGVQSDSYSFPYVASWSGGDSKTVLAAAETARRCALKIADDLDLLQDGTARDAVQLERTKDATQQHDSAPVPRLDDDEAEALRQAMLHHPTAEALTAIPTDDDSPRLQIVMVR